MADPPRKAQIWLPGLFPHQPVAAAGPDATAAVPLTAAAGGGCAWVQQHLTTVLMQDKGHVPEQVSSVHTGGRSAHSNPWPTQGRGSLSLWGIL